MAASWPEGGNAPHYIRSWGLEFLWHLVGEEHSAQQTMEVDKGAMTLISIKLLYMQPEGG